MSEYDPAQQIINMARELSDLRRAKEELEGRLKHINKLKTKLEQEQLPKAMIEQEIDSITIQDLGTLYLQNEVFSGILVKDQPEAFAWLRENGHGDLIKETVHPMTLKAFAKEMLENGVELPEVIKVTPTRIARLRRK